MAAKVYHVQRLSRLEYLTPGAFAAVLNQITAAGGVIFTIMSCSSIQPIDTYGYHWMDVVYTT